MTLKYLRLLLDRPELRAGAMILDREETAKRRWFAQERYLENRQGKWVWLYVAEVIDIGPMSLEAGADEIRRLGIDRDTTVTVCWLGDLDAMELTLGAFLDAFRYLWSPSEDVIVFDKALSFLLSISHEERLAYCKAPQGDGSIPSEVRIVPWA